MTAASVVEEWLGVDDGETKRLAAWDQDARPVTGNRRLNGGWCWIHRPNEAPICIVFVKNHLEQSHEALGQPDLLEGKALLEVRLSDLRLFPLICADMLRPRMENGSIQSRLERSLRDELLDLPILVTASLLQSTAFDPNWQTAIGDVAAQISNQAVVIAVANQAYGKLHPEEELDRWRSLSGVFGRRTDLNKGHEAFPAGRAVQTPHFNGLVLRDSGPCVVCGDVAWPPYTPISSLVRWRAVNCCPINAGRIETDDTLRMSTCDFELHRFTLRYPQQADFSSSLGSGLQKIRAHLETGNYPSGSLIAGSIISGVDRDPDMNGDDFFTVANALSEGLNTLAFVADLDGSTWQQDPAEAGQMRRGETNVLVWRDPRLSGRAIMRTLQDWALKGAAHPPLQVIARGNPDDVALGPVIPDRKSDISQPPTEEGDWAAARSIRKIRCVPLGTIAAIYADGAATIENVKARASDALR
ncbi:hypothetical protein FSZ31_06405 [Sphingorhabdus soli]|uniref:ABC-three component systems C-terminal domain-containing protein n=1 Tax=Flavisphingopyxis soli TaxID=2601267 RepID=A0A5C6UP12_9SPHN|nr:ABC-three component system protein [Sphingorhabdus soli]TXC74324.1 hypothetical protein FSZ31_06405 [Sphingorhabdus soli]